MSDIQHFLSLDPVLDIPNLLLRKCYVKKKYEHILLRKCYVTFNQCYVTLCLIRHTKLFYLGKETYHLCKNIGVFVDLSKI